MERISLKPAAIGYFIDRLLGGGKICVQGVSCSGKTTLLERVREQMSALGDVSVVGIDPSTGLREVEARLAQLSASVERSGCAVVLVDDFDEVLHRCDDGPAIEARLHANCINSSIARAVGLLVTARPSSRLAAAGSRGSPLDAALTVTRPVPGLDEYDLSEAALVSAEFDKHAWYEDLLSSCKRRAPSDAVPLLSVRLASDLSGEDTQLLSAVRGRVLAGKSHAYSDKMRHLFPLLYEVPGTGRASMPSLVLASETCALGVGAAWPTDIASSARRFAARVGRAGEAYWIDKYLGSPPRLLRRFIDMAAMFLPPLKLRLLTSNNALGASDRSALTHEIRAGLEEWRRRGIEVHLRIMPPSDEVRLHERQLSFQRRVDGYVLPPFDRIVCRAAPGNASDRYMPMVDVAFALNAWARADVLV